MPHLRRYSSRVSIVFVCEVERISSIQLGQLLDKNEAKASPSQRTSHVVRVEEEALRGELRVAAQRGWYGMIDDGVEVGGCWLVDQLGDGNVDRPPGATPLPTHAIHTYPARTPMPAARWCSPRPTTAGRSRPRPVCSRG